MKLPRNRPPWSAPPLKNGGHPGFWTKKPANGFSTRRLCPSIGTGSAAALWSASSHTIGVAALLGDELFLNSSAAFFVMTELGRSLFPAPCGGGPVRPGAYGGAMSPQRLTTRACFLGVGHRGLARLLAAWFYGGEDIGFLSISSLFLLAAVIYGARLLSIPG